jgi:hypothetical protein
MIKDWLKNKTIVVASKHEKDKVIKPLFDVKFDSTFLSCNIDTDQLGTFSGEIKRILTPYEAAIEKCRMAFNETDADFAISSEGSFGPHPTLFFVPADEELMLFMSRNEELIIWAKHISTETNYNQIDNPTEQELIDFLANIQFPSHKVIFKSEKKIKKDIENLNILNQLVSYARQNKQTFRIETDMRAHCNPSRMKVIEETTHKLIEKINSNCPSCELPGFSVQEAVKGLPCSQCGLPTQSTLKHIKVCQQCNHQEEIFFPRGIKEEDPTYCSFCNP